MDSGQILDWTLEMPNLPRLTEPQLLDARKLIKKRCCNYDHGQCLALDDGIVCACVQWYSYSLLCKWFRNAVLPAAPELEAGILKLYPRKRCVICNAPVYSKSNRAKYCPTCAKKERRRKEAVRLHNHYLKSRI